MNELLPLENVSSPLLLMDNQSAMKLIKNPQFHKRSKHISVRYHFIRQKFEEGKFELLYALSNEESQFRKLCFKICVQRLEFVL